MSTTDLPSLPKTPAEAADVRAPAFPLATGSEWLRFHGERPEKHRALNAESACGNCKHLKPDHSHPLTDGQSILKRRGWICDCPDLGCFSGWTTEGCCECHERLSFPNVRDEPRAKRVGSGPWLGVFGASTTQGAEPTQQANDHP